MPAAAGSARCGPSPDARAARVPHALGLAQIAADIGFPLVRRAYASKPELVVEVLPPRHRVKDDLPVRSRSLKQTRDNLFAETPTLVARQHGDVAQVGAVPAIGEARPAAMSFPSSRAKARNMLLVKTSSSSAGRLSPSGAAR